MYLVDVPRRDSVVIRHSGKGRPHFDSCGFPSSTSDSSDGMRAFLMY